MVGVAQGAGNETKVEAASAAFTGAWSGEVTYSWGAKYTEPFFFQPEGNKLFGTVVFLGVKRGIEEGKIEGETISFRVRYRRSIRRREPRTQELLLGKTER